MGREVVVAITAGKLEATRVTLASRLHLPMAKSNDVRVLTKDTEHGVASASDQAEQARNHALDPTLSGSELNDGRKCMDDAAFKRDRLQAALGKLRERLAQLKYQEENARRQVAYDRSPEDFRAKKRGIADRLELSVAGELRRI
jgi:hypothetical protein